MGFYLQVLICYVIIRLLIGDGTRMNLSNRDITKLFDSYNPNKIKSGDLVKVSLSHSELLSASSWLIS